jgi:hypothetical protein
MKHSLPSAALSTLLLLGSSVGSSVRAHAEEAVAALPAAPPAASDGAIDAWVASLGCPTPEDALGGLPAHPRSLGAADALRVVRALRDAGGVHASVALRELATHRDDAVRVAAIEAAGEIGLRSKGTTVAVRVGLSAREPGVRAASLRAIARLGDARDVPGLMATLCDEDPAVRAPALAALRGITGVRLSDCARTWDRWWILSRKVVRDRLDVALDALERAPGDAACEVSAVARYAWVDLPGVENEMRVWLRSPDSARRAAAARVVALARLGDVACDVESVLRYTDDPALFDVAHESALALGISTTGILPPSGALAVKSASAR